MVKKTVVAKTKANLGSQVTNKDKDEHFFKTSSQPILLRPRLIPRAN